MIDLHSHILPGLDDGATDVTMSLEMARMYVDQGVVCVACTPHIRPGVYTNSGSTIRQAIKNLQHEIYSAGINLSLTVGADNHIVPSFLNDLRDGHLLSLADTRYVLLEAPHHVAPPRFATFMLSIVEAGLVPILTHPERLAWIDAKYETFVSLAQNGVWMQVTSGALTGQFGKTSKYWAERMLVDGLVHVLASDAHDDVHRPPNLDQGRRAAEILIGSTEAEKLVVERPGSVLRAASIREFSQPMKFRLQM